MRKRFIIISALLFISLYTTLIPVQTVITEKRDSKEIVEKNTKKEEQSAISDHEIKQTWMEYLKDLKIHLYVKYLCTKESCSDALCVIKKKFDVCSCMIKDMFLGD
ncbi:MAG TPA: hypothetical protein VEK38_03745 [Candidatus Bathyarchaeia archaeon]|nr:hypothetical protein [Candidatus Bathyarchaeia archaeon]